MNNRDRLIKLLNDNSYLDALDEEHLALGADQLLANGILVPRIKVDDTIYRLHPRHNMVVEWVIIEIIITEDEINYIDDSDNLIKDEDIGKTVFLTEEDAERALAERKVMK
jgi:hypothetical protein